ncbi:hypothetical protein Aau02nite_07980 [Amorphoplanes auranticolor]|uniref:Uncharacterized protein n=1 Tax=Actinoplanes auranticolor TaxID=47988 RepID=A0A919S5I9_9ACTN|nr:hypothetical protein Aau02nite_07980 [Actinoplanes auranticolor]
MHSPDRDEFAGGVEATLRLVGDAPPADDDHGPSLDGPGRHAGSRRAAGRLQGPIAKNAAGGCGAPLESAARCTAITVRDHFIAGAGSTPSWEKVRIMSAQPTTRHPS